jgi:hypothetical protein
VRAHSRFAIGKCVARIEERPVPYHEFGMIIRRWRWNSFFSQWLARLSWSSRSSRSVSESALPQQLSSAQQLLGRRTPRAWYHMLRSLQPELRVGSRSKGEIGAQGDLVLVEAIHRPVIRILAA